MLKQSNLWRIWGVLDKQKKRYEWGLRIGVNDLYTFSHLLIRRFTYILVVRGGESEEQWLEAIRKFTGRYKVLVNSPVYFDVADRKSEDFKRTMIFVDGMLHEKVVEGVVCRVGMYQVTDEKANNAFKGIFLKRMLKAFDRNKKRLIIVNDSYVKEQSFTTGYLLILKRLKEITNLGLHIGRAYYEGNTFLENIFEDNFKRVLKSLLRDYDVMMLSGIGKNKKERVSIQRCKKYQIAAYVELLRAFKGLVIFDYDDIQDAIADRDYLSILEEERK